MRALVKRSGVGVGQWKVIGWQVAALAALLAACSDDVQGTGGSTSSSGGAGAGGGSGGAAACPTGYDDCDGNPNTVCETPTDTAVNDCNECGNVCPTGGENQEPVCAAGSCGLACALGFEDCDEDGSNGCEAIAGQCSVETIVFDVDAPVGLDVDDAYLYYGSKGHAPDYTDGSIWRVTKDGGEPELIASGQNRPINVTVDDTHVYWANGGTPPAADGSIVRALKSGGDGEFEVLAQDMLRPSNPIVVGDTVYWTVREPGEIQSLPKDGSGVITTIVTGLVLPRDLAFHDGALYWATAGLEPDPPIVARKFLPAGSEQTLATGVEEPSYHIAIDDDNVYVGSFVDGTILAIPLIGGGPQELATDIGAASEVVVDESMVYFTTSSGEAVLKVPITGGETSLVAVGDGYSSYLTQDAEFVYWAAGDLNDPGGAIRRAPK